MNHSTHSTQQSIIEARKNPVLLGLSKFISIVFHPVFLPPIMMTVWHWFYPSSMEGLTYKDYNRLLLIVTLNTTVFSTIFVLMCKGLGLISSIEMPRRNDRIIPLLGIMVFYFWCNHVLGNIPHVPFAVRLLVLGGFWCVIAMFMANIFVKISLHTTGAGAAIALMGCLMVYLPVNMVWGFVASIIIGGLIGTARLISGQHKMFEIILGYVVGILVQTAAYIYLH